MMLWFVNIFMPVETQRWVFFCLAWTFDLHCRAQEWRLTEASGCCPHVSWGDAIPSLPADWEIPLQLTCGTFLLCQERPRCMACASHTGTDFSDCCSRVEMCWVQYCKCCVAMQHLPIHKTGPFFSSSMANLCIWLAPM